MRVILGALTGVLLLLGFAGIGLGIVAITQAGGDIGAGSADPIAQIVTAISAGAVPLAIGTLAMGAAVITLAVDQSRNELVAALRERTSAPPAARPGERAADRHADDWR